MSAARPAGPGSLRVDSGRKAHTRSRVALAGLALAACLLVPKARPAAAAPDPSAPSHAPAAPPDSAATAQVAHRPTTTIDSAEAGGEAWGRARALADQEHYDEALAVIRDGLRLSPHDTALLWLRAGVTGWAGRHQESVRLYEDVVARHPELAEEVRRDLAVQRLWAGDPEGAMRDLELRLAAEPGDGEARRMRALALAHADRLGESLAAYDTLLRETPGDAELSLERAQVLGWMGRHARAIAAYKEVLRSHPGNARARLGLGQNENWRGGHRRAAEIFQQLLADGARDVEIQKGLAWARYWSGQPAAAREVLAGVLAERPGDPEAQELAGLLAREGNASLIAGHERSEDSDTLRVRSSTLEYRHPLANGSAFSLHWRRDDVRDPAGAFTPYRIGAAFEAAGSARWSARALLAYHTRRGADRGRALGELALTHWPGDRLGLTLELARDAVMTRRALGLGIQAGTLSGALEWRAGDRVAVWVEEQLEFYSDHNRIVRGAGSLRSQVLEREPVRIALALVAAHLHAREDLDHGYYDPKGYVEFGPKTELEWSPADRWTLALDWQIGWQQERGSESDPFHNLTARAEVPLGKRFALSLEGGRSDSNLSSASGFRQNRWAAWFTTGF